MAVHWCILHTLLCQFCIALSQIHSCSSIDYVYCWEQQVYRVQKAALLLCLRHCHSYSTSSYHSTTAITMMQMMSMRRMTITITATTQPGVPERRMHNNAYINSHYATLGNACSVQTHTRTCTCAHTWCSCRFHYRWRSWCDEMEEYWSELFSV